MRGLFNDQMFRLAWNQCRRHNYNNYTNFGLINEIYFYDKYIDTIILDIINRINNKKYCFSTKYIVYIPKSNGLARRISVTTLEDQLVMQVILNYIAKKSDKNFIKASYGNRYQYKKGKLSTNIFKPYYEQFNKFINAIIYNIEQGYNWVGETDITAFHDTIAHTEIENSLKQYLNNADMQDRYIKKLIADFLKTDVIEHNERKKIIRGIPQGVELSNFLGNLVLDEIDKKMIQLDNIVYLRYVDDIRILGKSEESVREALIYLQKILLCRELYINNAKTKIYNVDLSLINKDKLRRLQREKLSIDKMKEIQFEEIEEDEEKNFDELKRMAERRNYLIKNYLIKKIYKEERYFHHIEDILDTNPKHYYLVKEIRKYRNKLPKNKIKNVYNKFLKNSYEVIKAPLIADTFDYYRDIEIDVDIKKIGEIQSINILMQEISIQDILKQLVRHVLTMDKYAINIGMKATICLLKEIECSDKWKQKVLEKLISSDIIFNDTNLFIDILFADNINNKRISSYINEHYNYTHQKYSKNSTHNTRETLFDKLKDKPIDFSTIKNIIKQIRLDLPESYCKNPGLINPYNITVNIGLDDKVKVNYLEDDKINIENKTPEDFLLMNVGNNYRITYMLGLIWFCLFTKEPMKIYNEIVPYIQFSPTKYKNKADIFEEMYFNYKERFEYELELIASLTKKSLAHRISIDKIFNMIENKKENLVKGKNEMKEINILHLSDLHFGMEPFKDTENEINSTKVAERVLTLKSLKKSLKDLTEEWKPQILVISGDIGWKGHEQDYIEAEEWITKLRNELNIKDIVVCPGNHDVDMDRSKFMSKPGKAQEADDFLAIENIGQYSECYKYYERFCEKLDIKSYKVGGTESHLCGEAVVAGIRFVMLNSAWFSKIKDVTGTLWMGLPQLKVMDANNQLANDEDGYLTIGVMHHPSEWLAYDEIHGCGGRRTSYQYFAQKTHLILSGHVHALPEKSKEATSGSKTRVITGGSTYAGNEYNNHCSIININLESNIMRRALVEYKSNTGEWKINYGYEDSIKIRD